MKQKPFFHYIRKVKGLPLSVVVSLVHQKIRKRAQYYLRKGQVILSPKGTSDKSFYPMMKIGGCWEEISEHFVNRKEPYFFWNDRELTEIIGLVRNVFPKSIEETIAAANKVCEHKFDLLGSGEKHLGDHINWHQDFKSGFVWNPKFYMDIEKINFENSSDIKVPWELSRFQHVTVLGKAYIYTQDEKYAKEFASQVSSWIDENPPMIGVNWVNAMEVAIRAVNLITGFHFLRRSEHLTPEFCVKFMKSLLEHGRFIIRNLEVRQVVIDGKVKALNGNHYMADIVGLVFLGLLFPEFKDSKDWVGLAVPELFHEILSQNNDDGVHYELSIGYHRLVTELCLSAIILCRKNGIEIPEDVLKRLEQMIEFTASYIKPDGLSPLLGDADDGRLLILDKNDINDHRYLLVIGSILFKREDFKALSGGFHEEALWLLGLKGYWEFNSIPPVTYIPKSESFEVSGFYIMRKNDLYIIITCNDNGINGTGGGHAHNDCLSFELAAFNQTIITDSGTYAYTEDLEKRNRFRSTLAHNTIMVDGEEMNRIPDGEAFRLENDARPLVNKWISNSEFDFFEGVHFGYNRLKDPVTHRRRIFFDKVNEFWVIKDILEGTRKHKIESFYHLSPQTFVKELDRNRIIVERNGKKLLFYSMDSNGNTEIRNDFVSHSYGKIREAKTILVSLRRGLPVSFLFIVLPMRKNENEMNLRDLITCRENFEKIEKAIVGPETGRCLCHQGKQTTFNTGNR
jgi:hypothetical protein